VPQTSLTPLFRLTQSGKRGLLALGHYRRALAHARFPGVVALCYHGVRGDGLPPGAMPFENLHVRASTFADHCRLVRETCDPISLDDWRAALAGRAPLPARPVLITFDDGYRSVLTVAAGILAEHRLPAVVFACTDPMARRRLLWFDDLASRNGEDAVEPWKARGYGSWLEACAVGTAAVADDDPRALLTPVEVAQLSRQPGIEIGAHTARHPVLAFAAPADQRAEIEQSRAALEQWTGARVRAFAYPNGRPGLDYDANTTAIVEELGFDFGFTMRQTFARADEPRLERSRFLVVAEMTAAELAHRLAYAWPR
jgi:peptidoglycan/xylan/chitin deacetylase (PgdA/CDA1 family)